MHKATYERHYKILSYIETEYYKQLNNLTKHQIKEDVKWILESISIIKNNLENYNNNLSQLRKNEKELINLLNEFYWLNKRIDLKLISQRIKDKK